MKNFWPSHCFALALAACAPAGTPAPAPTATLIAMPTAGARPTVPPPGELIAHDTRFIRRERKRHQGI